MRDNFELHDETNRQKFPKNNFFAYRWRVLDNFSKSIDRQLFQMQVQGSGNNQTLLSERILQLHKAREAGSKKDLISNLAQDAMQFLDRRRQDNNVNSKAELLLSKATQSLMDRTFSTLLAFSTELNTLLGVSELFIIATEPEVTKRVTKGTTSHATCVQSHIATTLFRIVIEGKHDTISFYMIPADSILAHGADMQARYQPLSTWTAQFAAQDQVYWVSANGVMTEGMLDTACAELIRILIDATQEAIAPHHAVVKREMNNFELEEVDPWVQENTNHTISSEGTRTDSVPSLASLFAESGVFAKVEPDFKPTSISQKSSVEQESAYVPSPEPVFEPPIEPSIEPTIEPSIESSAKLTSEELIKRVTQDQVDSQQQQQQQQQQELPKFSGKTINSLPMFEAKDLRSASQSVSTSDTPSDPFDFSQFKFSFQTPELIPGIILSSTNEETKKVEKDPSAFDLKTEYYADKPTKTPSKSANTRANRKKNRKKKK